MVGLTLGLLLVAYALGCLNTGYYLVRWRTGQDLRTLGSGNAGARNAGRILGKWGFVLVFLGDALKGALALGLARWLGVPAWGESAALIAVVAGHLWPLQLGGKGGKGVSTAMGGVLVLNPWLGLGAILAALLLLAVLRRFMLSGLVAFAMAPLIAWGLGMMPVHVAGVACLALLLLYAHRANFAAAGRAHTPAEADSPRH